MTDTIMIRINGKPIETTVDEEGTQRLPNRPIVQYLMHRAVMNFNELAELAGFGMVSQDDWRFIYQNTGTSVDHYADCFPEDEIDNPLWGDELRNPSTAEILDNLIKALRYRNRDHDDVEGQLFWADELERTAADLRKTGSNDNDDTNEQ